MAPFALAEKARWFMRVRSPVTLTLLGHAALALSLFTNDGSRDITGLLVVLLGIAAWGKALVGTIDSKGESAGVLPARRPIARAPLAPGEADRVAWLVALGSSLLAFGRAPGSHIHGGLSLYYVYSVVVLALLASYAFDLRGAVLSPSLVVVRRALLFLMAVVLGAWLLKASPDPAIDVFPLHQQVAQAILDGKSIYKPGVVSVLDTNHYDYIIPAYCYFPLSAYLTTIAFAATHDIRWANLVAQIVGGVLLWLVARRCARGPGGEELRETGALPAGAWADLIAAALLFHPRGLLVLEKAWTEPLAVPFLGGFVLLALAGRPVGGRAGSTPALSPSVSIAASISLGFLCAMKQHLALYVPFLMLVPGIGLRGVAIAGVVAIATLVPSLVASPLDFYRGAFGSIASGQVRTDALAIPAEVKVWLGLTVPSWVGFLAALTPFVWIRRLPRELGPLLLGSCVLFGLFYSFGRQAFCNYYYLLDATALFAAATLRAPHPSPPRAPGACPSRERGRAPVRTCAGAS